MRTLTQLADQLDKYAVTGPSARANDLSVKAAETILTDLLRSTPADTGKAISNWIVSLDEPSRLELPSYAPGKKGSTAVVCQTIALEAAIFVLRSKLAGQTIYICNSLPYIRVLDGGSSTQEPEGFVDRAMLLGRLFSENPADFADG
jgi:hypothetical protein